MIVKKRKKVEYLEQRSIAGPSLFGHGFSRIKASFVGLLLIAGVFGIAAFYHVKVSYAAPVDESCFYFNISNGMINGYDDSCPKDVDIPNTIDGVSVTSIASTAFQNKQLTYVSIPDSVLEIGWYAFENNLLTSIDIPDSVNMIGSFAFQNNQLASVTISESLNSISSYAFADNQLTSVVIPNSVNSIGYSAFQNNQITSVIIPDQVTSISEYAFDNNQISSVSLPDLLLSIGSYAFRGNQLTSVVIPASVTDIGWYTFDYNSLDSVFIQGNPTFGDYTFGRNGLDKTALPADIITVCTTFSDPCLEYYQNNAELVAFYATDQDFIANNQPGVSYLFNTFVYSAYMINPASVTLNYQTSDGSDLQDPITYTGYKQETGQYLTDYKIINTLDNTTDPENPTCGFTPYFTTGTTMTFTAPSFDSYITPADQTVTLVAGSNQVDFIYQQPAEPIVPGPPNTGAISGTASLSTFAFMAPMIASLLAVRGILGSF